MSDANEDTATIEIANLYELPAAPLVSVIMLAYGHEKFIAQAIEGIVAQQCDFPIELIIGDDCSADRTGEIARDYQRRHPQLIRLLTATRNVGMHANGARCLNACRGEFVAICEGDDYWHHPKKLQMQVELMRTNPHMSLCHTDFDRRTKFRLKRSIHQSYPSPWLAQGDAYLALLMEWSVMTCTTMFRKWVMDSFKSTEYANPLWPFGDRNLLLYSSLKGSVGYIDQSTATYRKRLGSASHMGSAAGLKMALGNLNCIELFIARNPTEPEIMRSALSRMHNWVYRAAVRAGELNRMRKSYKWLCVNGTPPPRILHYLLTAAVITKIPIWMLAAARAMKNRYLSAM